MFNYTDHDLPTTEITPQGVYPDADGQDWLPASHWVRVILSQESLMDAVLLFDCGVGSPSLSI